MEHYETQATIGPDGQLTLDHLPFAAGQTVRVQVQAEKIDTARKPFVFGLHAGLIEMSPDFNAPLPDSFWLGEDLNAVAS